MAAPNPFKTALVNKTILTISNPSSPSRNWPGFSCLAAGKIAATTKLTCPKPPRTKHQLMPILSRTHELTKLPSPANKY